MMKGEIESSRRNSVFQDEGLVFPAIPQVSLPVPCSEGPHGPLRTCGASYTCR